VFVRKCVGLFCRSLFTYVRLFPHIGVETKAQGVCGTILDVRDFIWSVWESVQVSFTGLYSHVYVSFTYWRRDQCWRCGWEYIKCERLYLAELRECLGLFCRSLFTHIHLFSYTRLFSHIRLFLHIRLFFTCIRLFSHLRKDLFPPVSDHTLSAGQNKGQAHIGVEADVMKASTARIRMSLLQVCIHIYTSLLILIRLFWSLFVSTLVSAHTLQYRTKGKPILPSRPTTQVRASLCWTFVKKHVGFFGRILSTYIRLLSYLFVFSPVSAHTLQ